MLDAQGRITIKKELLSKNDFIKANGVVKLFYNPIIKCLLIKSECFEGDDNLYYISTHKLDTKCRMFMPISIQKAFPGATYLVSEKDGNIYIHIIEH